MAKTSKFKEKAPEGSIAKVKATDAGKAKKKVKKDKKKLKSKVKADKAERSLVDDVQAKAVHSDTIAKATPAAIAKTDRSQKKKKAKKDKKDKPKKSSKRDKEVSGNDEQPEEATSVDDSAIVKRQKAKKAKKEKKEKTNKKNKNKKQLKDKSKGDGQHITAEAAQSETAAGANKGSGWNDWTKADLGDDQKKNKFLRLMGLGKSKGGAGSAKTAQTKGTDVNQGKRINQLLESQFNTALQSQQDARRYGMKRTGFSV